MIEEIRLPEISENVDSGQVLKVKAKVGDFIQKEQPLAEIETERPLLMCPRPGREKSRKFISRSLTRFK